jgi:predicted RNA-binding Zn-ribbon protein involved in translation (DUF1610 family)
MAEYWTKGADDWKGPQMPTDVQSGQLRLVREGAKASCQVSDGPGKPFATIFEKDDFSTDDIVHLRFHVTDGQKPGYAVDARLVDLRVRYGRRAAEPDAKVQAKNPVQPPERPAAKNNWLAMTLGLCLATTLVFASVVALLLYVFRRSPFQGAAPALEQVAFVCAGCGKSLKTKAVSAGKKLKCPQCGTTGVVPSPGVAPS